MSGSITFRLTQCQENLSTAYYVMRKNHTQVAGGGSASKMARVTGLEPATSCVTGRRSNRLSYTR